MFLLSCSLVVVCLTDDLVTKTEFSCVECFMSANGRLKVIPMMTDRFFFRVACVDDFRFEFLLFACF